MDNTEKVAGRYSNIINTLTDDEDFADTQDQNVSISVGGHGGKRSRAAVLGLIVLAVILFAIDVSLVIYYNQMTDGIPQSGEGLKKFLETYRSTMENRDKALKQLDGERRQIGVTRWELEHQKRRGRDYTTLVETVLRENAELQALVARMMVDCGHCSPGWIHIDSKCFYLSDANQGRKSWQEARQNCQRKGGDLAIVDSNVKQSTLNMHIQDRAEPNAPRYTSGYWMGLRDTDEEGTWKWLNGELLSTRFWFEGEPNDVSNEDCAANYPSTNPFSAWNDAPCTFSLKWICEKTSLSAL